MIYPAMEQTAEHSPVEVDVEVSDLVGGVLIYEKDIMQVRCGCTHALQHDWGHHIESA